MSLDRSLEYRQFIESWMQDWLETFRQEPQKRLYEAMGYSLLAGGKRLRPIFVLDFCRMCGGQWQDAAGFAGAVEMIHTYSLIHDDLPAMDNDDFRRGRPTNHKVYGEGMAILAGDALLTDAFGLAASVKLPRPSDMARAIAIMAREAGSLGMVGGQVLDIMSQQRTLSQQEVIDIQSRKTGCLISMACQLGVLAGGGSEGQLEAARTFANALGMAFQIRDDMLDVIGTQEEMGKGVGTDETKNTFVKLWGLEKCRDLVQSYTDKAILALSGFENNDYMIALAKSLTDRRV